MNLLSSDSAEANENVSNDHEERGIDKIQEEIISKAKVLASLEETQCVSFKDNYHGQYSF